MRIILLIIGFFFSFQTFSQSTAQQRKDSLSRTPSIMDDRLVPTSYLFDSLFVVSEKYLKHNLRLAKSMNYSQLIQSSKDSSVFYVQTGKSIILNGKLLKPQKNYIHIDKCEKNSIKVITEKILKEKFNVNNTNGAFVIYCN